VQSNLTKDDAMGAANTNSEPLGGELSQEMIDQMLNGGSGDGLLAGDLTGSVDPWSNEQLRAEIEAAQIAAGIATLDAVESSAMSHLPDPTPMAAAPAPVAPTAVHPVQFMPLTPEPPATDSAHGIELLMDVALEVSVTLGSSHMSIGEILALRTGSVVELDKLAGEPVDVSVNGTLVARGEVVVVDEKFGVRITEVVSRARRIASLG
jgi:flagellar motor switch protein FliN/FliY